MEPSAYRSNPFDLVRPSLSGVRTNLVPGILAYLSFAVAIVVMVVVAIVLHVASPLLTVLVILVGLALLVTYFLLPIYRFNLASAKQESVTYSQLMQPNTRLAWRLFGTSILAALTVVGGFILFVVPGVIFLAWFSYANYVVLNEGLAGPAALGRSRALARDRLVETYGALSINVITDIFRIVPAIGSLLGTVAIFCVSPVVPLRYLELSALKAKGEEAVAGEPKSGMNWLAIVLAIVVMIIVSAVTRQAMTPGLHY